METRSNWKCKIVPMWNVKFYTHFPSERYFFVSHSLGAIKNNKNLRRVGGRVQFLVIYRLGFQVFNAFREQIPQSRRPKKKGKISTPNMSG